MSHSRGPRCNPTLNSGEARHAALVGVVARFAARRALAVRRRLLLNKPTPRASQRLLGRLISSLPAIFGRGRRIRRPFGAIRRALAIIADCGISTWLP